MQCLLLAFKIVLISVTIVLVQVGLGQGWPDHVPQTVQSYNDLFPEMPTKLPLNYTGAACSIMLVIQGTTVFKQPGPLLFFFFNWLYVFNDTLTYI